jgi:hypothetical protein
VYPFVHAPKVTEGSAFRTNAPVIVDPDSLTYLRSAFAYDIPDEALAVESTYALEAN